MLVPTEDRPEGFTDVGRGKDAHGTLGNEAEHRGNIDCKSQG